MEFVMGSVSCTAGYKSEQETLISDALTTPLPLSKALNINYCTKAAQLWADQTGGT